MDEPLAALDEERKAETFPHFERLRDGMDIPIVYASYSVAEVRRVADRVAIMAGGRVAAIGTPSEVLKGKLLSAHERRESGSILAGTVRSVDVQHGPATVAAGGLWVAVPDPALHEGSGSDFTSRSGT
jgi:ABC-type molybdate transport system, ATPase component